MKPQLSSVDNWIRGDDKNDGEQFSIECCADLVLSSFKGAMCRFLLKKKIFKIESSFVHL